MGRGRVGQLSPAFPAAVTPQLFERCDNAVVIYLDHAATAPPDPRVVEAIAAAALRFEDDDRAARFQALMGSPEATYQELVDSLGPDVEGGYFLYRFSDPSYVVARAVMSAVAGTVLKGGGRAIDVCGGSGHLTRTLLELSSPAPVIADL